MPARKYPLIVSGCDLFHNLRVKIGTEMKEMAAHFQTISALPFPLSDAG